MALEEPQFDVVRRTDDYEIRLYASHLVAEVDVDGDHDEAGNRAFGILAGYIFGDNGSAEKMAMTAPVTSTESSTAGANYTYAFVMERAYTMETLPQPNDPRIRLRAMPSRIMAVRQYSGRWTEAKYKKNERALMQSLQADGVTVTGEPILARYDPPFMPWFLRRNEVMVEIRR